MMVFYIILMVILFLADQISKHYALLHLSGGKAVQIIPGLFEFVYVENRGIAFGMLQNMHYVIIPVSLLVMALSVYLVFRGAKKKNTLSCVCLSLIIAGAAGNVCDKIFRGFVVDFIHTTFMEFPVFNVADSFICVGAFVLAVVILFFDKEEKNENKL